MILHSTQGLDSSFLDSRLPDPDVEKTEVSRFLSDAPQKLHYSLIVGNPISYPDEFGVNQFTVEIPGIKSRPPILTPDKIDVGERPITNLDEVKHY